MKSAMLFVFVILVSGEALGQAPAYTYSMEYQFRIDRDFFVDGRGAGIDVYISAWSQFSGIDTSTFDVTETVRQEAITNIRECNSDAAVRVRNYVQGDLDGLVTVDIKAVKDGLSQQEAEAEPFAPSEAYEDVSDWQIERDVHPCQADYSANTRVFLNAIPDIQTCADVAAFYPDAVDSTSASIGLSSPNGFTYLYILNGTYAGFPVSLTTELVYQSLDDALNDNKYRGGEFSYTILGANMGHTSFTQQQIALFDEDYFNILEFLESPDLPCEDELHSSVESPSSATTNESPTTNETPTSDPAQIALFTSIVTSFDTSFSSGGSGANSSIANVLNPTLVVIVGSVCCLLLL